MRIIPASKNWLQRKGETEKQRDGETELHKILLNILHPVGTGTGTVSDFLAERQPAESPWPAGDDSADYSVLSRHMPRQMCIHNPVDYSFGHCF